MHVEFREGRTLHWIKTFPQRVKPGHSRIYQLWNVSETITGHMAGLPTHWLIDLASLNN